MRRPSIRSRPSWTPQLKADLAWALATAFVATVVAIVDLKLWRMDPHVPIFDVTGDGSYYLATVKDVVENGWFWHNPDLAAPFGQTNFDFAAPFGDVAHFVIVRLLGIVLGDPVVVFNAFFLVCFVLIAVIAYAVLRDLGAARAPALVAAVLFAFVPYHLARNETHLFLTSYYAIPLAVWLVVTVAEGRRLLDRDRAARRRTLLVVGVCLVVGAASNYYAVFALLMLLTVVPVAALARRSPAIALQGAAVTALVALSFVLCHSPAIVYPLVHGANEGVAKRQPSDSEKFGLKLTYMVIPRPEHRVGFMAQRGKAYLANTAQRGEGFDPSLGIVATAGLAAALLALLTTGLGAAASLRRSRAAIAGAVALSSFLIGTVGGVSALIAFEISPQVRAWNRLSLVIAFAALLTIALLLTALGDRLRARGRPAWAITAVVAAIGVAGLLDQTSPSDAPAYPAVAASWKVDEDFVSAIEQRLPGEAKILQLPYMSYPEHGQLNGISDYDLFKGYLHSARLKWTYGAIEGRSTDWLANHPALTPAQLAAAATAAGFGGVYLDTYGYQAGGAGEVAAALGQVAGPGTALVSADQRLRFYDLQPAARRLQSRTAGAAREQIAAALLHPVALGYGAGFSYQETDGPRLFRWAGPDARLTLDNPLRGARELRFTAQLFAPTAQPSTVTLTLPGAATKTLTVTDQGTPVSLPFSIAKGDASLRLQTAGPAAPNPGDDARDRRLRIVDPQIEDARLQDPRYVAAVTP
jgi:phosphoglycerol transferase